MSCQHEGTMTPAPAAPHDPPLSTTMINLHARTTQIWLNRRLTDLRPRKVYSWRISNKFNPQYRQVLL